MKLQLDRLGLLTTEAIQDWQLGDRMARVRFRHLLLELLMELSRQPRIQASLGNRIACGFCWGGFP